MGRHESERCAKREMGREKRKKEGRETDPSLPSFLLIFCVRTFSISWTRLSQSLEQARGVGTKRWPIDEYFLYLAGLRLLAVGRNQYIELMNTCRSSKV